MSPSSQNTGGGCTPGVRAALRGPWPTIRTPFTCGGEIDYPSLHKLVDFMIEDTTVRLRLCIIVVTCVLSIT